MIIAACIGEDGKIPALFADTQQVWIIETDTLEVTSILRDKDAMTNARYIVQQDCEAVLCGAIEEAPFVVLADEGHVTRYAAAGLTPEEATKRLLRFALDYIKDYIGGTGCESEGKQHEKPAKRPVVHFGTPGKKKPTSRC